MAPRWRHSRAKGHFFGGRKNKRRHNLRRDSETLEYMPVTIAGRIEQTFHVKPSVKLGAYSVNHRGRPTANEA